MNDKPKGCHYGSGSGDELLEFAKSVDCGVMSKIIAKTPLGIEWESSKRGTWFMQIPSMETLILGWDGMSSVNWFFDATFYDSTETQALVLVPPNFMREIKSFVESLQQAP